MSLHENIDPNTKGSATESQKPGGVWTTVIEINPEYPNYLVAQRIIDSLRVKPSFPIDPEIIKKENEDLWGPDSDS